MKSLQSRLNLGLGVTLAAVFVLLGVAGSLAIRFVTENYVDSRLEHDAESLLAALAFAPDGTPQLRPGRVDPVYQRVFSGHYYRIDLPQAELRSRSLWDQDLPVHVPEPGRVARLRAEGPEGQLLLVRVAGYRKAGVDLTIAVAEELSPIRTEMRRLQLGYLLFVLAALAVTLLVQRRALHAGLAPVQRTARQVSALEQGARTRLDGPVPEEIRPLVMEINRLLEAQQRRLTRSRNALGNLAHALKTPLTVIAQTAERPELKQCPDLARELHACVAQLRTRVDRELRRARLAGATGTGGRAEPGVELEALVEVLRRLYRDRNLDIELRVAPGSVFPGDREDLLELAGNLLDNACKWARTRVRVNVEADGGLRLVVEDDGPGCSEAELQRLATRGVRTDESAPGHGLGLAIVHDIVEDYGGSLRFSRSDDLGGFRVEVVL